MISVLNNDINARVDATMRARGVELKGSLEVMSGDGQPSAQITAGVNMKKSFVSYGDHVEVNGDAKLDVASTGSPCLCFDLFSRCKIFLHPSRQLLRAN